MARLLLLVAICALPALVSAGLPFWLEGHVYCDTCLFGFKTPLSYYISGSKVMLECRDRVNLQVTFSKEAVTGADGRWEMEVEEDRRDDICTVHLVSSAMAGCKKPDPGRNSASVVLTRYNGVVSNRHRANSIGFLKDTPLHGCAL